MSAWNLSDLVNVPRNGLTVMSTFACGGGSSMGYKLAGFDVIAANDIDPEMAWHYKKNIKPRHYYLMPIKKLVDMARAKTLPPELYSLDVLDGSPPCSSFSTAGKRDKKWGKSSRFREGQADQVLDDLFFDYLDLVAALRPRVSIAENVKGITVGRAKGYVSLILARYKAIGYSTQMFLIDAADHGVPQTRLRVFFIATRDERQPLAIKKGARGTTAGRALRGVDIGRTSPLGPVCLHLWKSARPGENLSKASLRAGGPNKMWSVFKLNPDKICQTIPATDNLLHWAEPRALTLRERIRLGSFPEDYVFHSDRIGRYMIGMSVPPLLAKAVAEAVRDQWLTGRRP